MDQKIRGLVKDALILTIITLISGFLLAFVFQITKEPIAIQAYEKKMKAYKNVFNKATTFKDDDNSKKLLKNSSSIIKKSGNNYGKVGIEEILTAFDNKNNPIGYVATVYSDEGYGGRIRISIGYDTKNKELLKMQVLEASETAGLGAKISTPKFYNQYNNKKVSQLKLVKKPVSNSDEIQAISGATISSRAVTNSINAGLLVLGGTNEK